MIAAKIHNVRACLGGLAGRVSPAVWEEIRAAQFELADAETQVAHMEGDWPVPCAPEANNSAAQPAQ